MILSRRCFWGAIFQSCPAFTIKSNGERKEYSRVWPFSLRFDRKINEPSAAQVNLAAATQQARRAQRDKRGK
jgi:hypothetical protein